MIAKWTQKAKVKIWTLLTELITEMVQSVADIQLIFLTHTKETKKNDVAIILRKFPS